MASPTEVTVFGGYFPFALRYSLDVPVLFNQYGLDEIWKQEYAKVGVQHISAGAWDPCHFATKKPVTSLKDLEGMRVFTFPTAGRFLSRFGVIPVTLPWEDVEVALQTGELDAIAWSGITEDYTVGWADVTNYFLTRQPGALERASRSPEGSVPRLHRCLALLPPGVNGDKLKLTTIPAEEWAKVEAEAKKFWDEIAAESEVKAKVVAKIKEYNEVMEKAGPPYRYG